MQLSFRRHPSLWIQPPRASAHIWQQPHVPWPRRWLRFVCDVPTMRFVAEWAIRPQTRMLERRASPYDAHGRRHNRRRLWEVHEANSIFSTTILLILDKFWLFSESWLCLARIMLLPAACRHRFNCTYAFRLSQTALAATKLSSLSLDGMWRRWFFLNFI